MKSPQIQLVAFEEAHFDLLVEWSPTPEFLLQWAGVGLRHPLDRGQLRRLLESAGGAESRTRLYSVRDAGGAIVGHAELGLIDRSHESAKLMRILVGPAELRGQGYGEAITRELVRIGFEELGLHRLDLNVFDFNESAIRCYERVGFRTEATLRDARKIGDEYWNLCIMGLLREEWEDARC